MFFQWPPPNPWLQHGREHTADSRHSLSGVPFSFPPAEGSNSRTQANSMSAQGTTTRIPLPAVLLSTPSRTNTGDAEAHSHYSPPPFPLLQTSPLPPIDAEESRTHTTTAEGSHSRTQTHAASAQGTTRSPQSAVLLSTPSRANTGQAGAYSPFSSPPFLLLQTSPLRPIDTEESCTHTTTAEGSHSRTQTHAASAQGTTRDPLSAVPLLTPSRTNTRKAEAYSPFSSPPFLHLQIPPLSPPMADKSRTQTTRGASDSSRSTLPRSPPQPIPLQTPTQLPQIAIPTLLPIVGLISPPGSPTTTLTPRRGGGHERNLTPLGVDQGVPRALAPVSVVAQPGSETDILRRMGGEGGTGGGGGPPPSVADTPFPFHCPPSSVSMPSSRELARADSAYLEKQQQPQQRTQVQAPHPAYGLPPTAARPTTCTPTSGVGVGSSGEHLPRTQGGGANDMGSHTRTQGGGAHNIGSHTRTQGEGTHSAGPHTDAQGGVAQNMGSHTRTQGGGSHNTDPHTGTNSTYVRAGAQGGVAQNMGSHSRAQGGGAHNTGPHTGTNSGSKRSTGGKRGRPSSPTSHPCPTCGEVTQVCLFLSHSPMEMISA